MTEATTETETFYMTRLWLRLRRLMELARALHLPVRSLDENYIVHCALCELFGHDAPSPFCIEGSDGRFLRTLGYSGSTLEELEDTARANASPLAYQIPEWSRSAEKPMPVCLPEGARLTFSLRACPVVRKSSPDKRGRGGEVDAFLARVWEVDDPEVPVDREEVYRDWLADQLDRRGGARLLSAGLERFSIELMIRRDHSPERKPATIKRPDATLAGTLEVTDSEKFSQLLRRGLGRHKSFGFGMLKIRPAGGR